MLKKILFSAIFGLGLFLLVPRDAFAACTQVATNQTTCSGTQTVACMQSLPTPGNIRRWCCDDQTSCDAAKGAIQQQITEKMASTNSPTSSTPTWYNSSFGDWYGKVYDPNNPSEIFGERYTAAQVQWVVYGLFSFLINSAVGPENAKIVQCFISGTGNVSNCVDALKEKIASNQSSLPVAAKPPDKNLWHLVFATNRPISGIGYIKEKLDNFGIVPVAHAQTAGFGFAALDPVQNIWKAVRDISYGLFVIAAIIMAFMIMFRVKISPQIVISVQSAIPKIVIALILVTFSYAIAGFLIDLMYVIYGLISLAFGSMGGLIAGTPSQVFMWMTQGQAAQGGTNNVNLGVFILGAVYIVAFILGFIIMLIFNIGVLVAAISALAIGGVAALIGSIPVLGPIIGILATLLVIFIIIVIVVFFVRIIFSLLKAFANIILLTIFAPLEITAGVVIPSFGFGTWVKSYISNLAVFVVTSTLFLFSYIFLAEGWEIGLTQFTVQGAGGWLSAIFGVGVVSSFNPSISSAAWPPLIGGGNSPSGVGLLLMGVSLVIFTLIPKANDLIQAVISGKPFAYGTAVGEALGPAYGLTFGPRVEGIKRTMGESGTKEDIGKIMGAIREIKGKVSGQQPRSE